MTVETLSDGKYKLKSGVSGGAGPYVWGDWTNNDSGTNGWYFAPVECAGYTNAYTLQQTNAEGTYLYWGGGGSGAWGNEVYGSGSTANGKNSYWLLISKATRQTLDGVTSENPLDVTYLIGDPDFEKRVSNGNNSTATAGSGQTSTFWTCGGFWRQYSSQTFANGIFFEKYDGGGLTTADKIYQSPTLKPGKYILSATAYASCTKAYLYAGSASKQISAAGKYEVRFTVASEGAVELGVKIDADGTGTWVAFDNVRLYYLGGGATSSITNPNFDSNADSWTGAGTWGNSEVEFYNTTSGFDMYQDLTGLTAGIYAVEAQGFYRNGAGIDEKRAKANESLLAMLYAMGEDEVERNTTLLSMYEEAGKVTANSSLFGDVPNWMNQAQDFISAGYYNDNKVIVEVGEAGTLRIGAKKFSGISADWTILDNFSLTKLTYSTLAEAYSAEWTARKAKAQALLNSSDYSNIVSGSAQRTALANAIALTPSDMEGYTAALVSLRTAVNNFKATKYAYDLYVTNSAAATTVYEAEATTYVNVTGDEKTTFNSSYSTYVSSFSPATNNAENYYNAATAIASATAAFTVESIKNNYDEYAAEVATATLLGTDITGVSAPTTSAEALAAAHEINVLNYAKVVAEEYEDVSATTLGAWTDVNVVSRRGQHWDGTTDGTTGTEYFEMNEGWWNNSWTMSRSQSISLAAGKYILKVAARVSTSANATLSVTVGGSTISTISGHQGDTGLGITTSGEGCYISHDTDDSKLYANNNAGRGFEWKYIPFELAETGTATLSFTAEGHAQYQFVSFTSLALLTDPKVAARTALLNKINEATTVYASGANVGSGIFQIPSSAATTFSGAISAAQGVYDNEDAVLDDITGATTTLDGAISTYQNITLNSPDPEKNYALLVKSGDNLNKVIAAAKGSDSETNPNGYSFNVNNDLADGVVISFTQVSGNDYNISYTVGGNTVYMTYGSLNGSTAEWKKQQIQGTTNAENKGTFRIVKTTTDCIFKIYNTEDDNYIDCQNGGSLYTDTNIENERFTLHEITGVAISESATSAPTANPLANVTLTRTLTKDTWNTFCVPFDLSAAQIAASALNGATIKQFASSDENVINLEAATSIVAGEPYLVKPSTTIENPTFNYVVVENTDGVVKGEGDYQFVGQVYNKTLDTDGTVAYLSTSGSIKKLTSGSIKGLRAYFKIPVSGAPARIAFLDEDDTTTGITEMQTENTATNTKAYDLSGRRVEAMKKGIYIVNGKKVVK